MIRIEQSRGNKRKYKYIAKLFRNSLKKHKNILPKKLTIKIYDFVGTQTGFGFVDDIDELEIDFNLAEILFCYRNPQEMGRKPYYQNKIKGFRNYLLFVLYHELGHLVKGFYNAEFISNRNFNAKEHIIDRFSYYFIKKDFK